MKCFTVRRLLHDVVDDLQDDATRAARRHLDSCPACRAEYDQLAGTRQQLASLAPGPAPVELVQATLASIDAAELTDGAAAPGLSVTSHPPRRLRLVASHVAAALLGAAAVFLFWLGIGGWGLARTDRDASPPGSDVAQVDMRDDVSEREAEAEAKAEAAAATEPEADPDTDTDPDTDPDTDTGNVRPLPPRVVPWLALHVDGEALGRAVDRLTATLAELPANLSLAVQFARSQPADLPEHGPVSSTPDIAVVDVPPETGAPAQGPPVAAASLPAGPLSPLGIGALSLSTAASVDPAPSRPSVVIRRYDDHVELVTRSSRPDAIVPQLIAYLDDPDPTVAAAALQRLEMIRETLGDPVPTTEEPPREKPGLLARLFDRDAEPEVQTLPSETERWHAWWSSRADAASSL